MKQDPTLLETILEGLEEAVVAVDADGKIAAVNTAAELLLENSRTQMLGQPFTETCDIDEELEGALANAFEGEGVKLAETTIIRHGIAREMILTSATVTPLYPRPNMEIPHSESHSPQGAVITLRDIRKLRELEELVRRQDRVQTIGVVASGLAHEIKNPLSGIRGAAQLISRSLPAEEQEGCDLILREVDRLRRLVEELLDAGHPRTLTLKPTNIHQVIHRAIRLIPNLQNDSISFVQNYDPSLPSILGDADSLEQVFLNILSNAVEALDNNNGNPEKTRERTITISTSLPGETVRLAGRKMTAPDHDLMPVPTTETTSENGATDTASRGMVVIRISDTGPGIAPEVFPQLFTPFFTTKDDGTGLGLVISHRIITEHGGSIQVESSPQSGTTFSVHLPLASTGTVAGTGETLR